MQFASFRTSRDGLIVADSVGNRSTIYRTSNGGISWDEHVSALNTYGDNYVWLSSESVLWLNPSENRLYHTSNDGDMWQRDSAYGLDTVSLGDIPKGMLFLDSLHGYIGNTPFVIFSTADGGKHWNIVHGFDFATTVADVHYPVQTFAFASPSFGLALTGDRVIYILRTTDGGKSWANTSPDMLHHPIEGSLMRFALPDTLRAWVCTRSDVYRSSDGGSNWSPVNVISDTEQHSFQALSFSGSYGAVGGSLGSYGVIYVTTNDGISWSRTVLDSGEAITQIFFTDSTTAFALSNKHLYTYRSDAGGVIASPTGPTAHVTVTRSHDRIRIVLPDAIPHATIRIYDLLGHELCTGETDRTATSFDIRCPLTPSMILCTVQTEQGISTYKLLPDSP